MATLNYNGGNQLTQVQEPGGRLLTMSYDGGNNLIGIIDAAGSLFTFSYDGSNRMINQKVGPVNTTFTYSGTNGSLTQVDRGLGSTTAITAAAGQGLGAVNPIRSLQSVSVYTDALGNTTTTTLDSLGRVIQVQTADGSVQYWTLDAAGNPTLYVDQLGRATLFTYTATTTAYNSVEDLTQVQWPDGTFTTYQYDPTFHQITQIQDALNHFTTNTYDPTFGNQLTAMDALGFVTTFTWSNGLKQTTTDALGRVTTLMWNSSRQEVAEIDALGNRTTFGYDSAGNQNSMQDALGRLTTSSFDGNRRLLTVTNALNGVLTYAYDGAGNQISMVDQLGRPTSYVYDQRNFQIAVTEALGTPQQRTTTTNFDPVGNTLYVTDPNGDITSFAYYRSEQTGGARSTLMERASSGRRPRFMTL